ncbi:hypothetical protein KSP40_PGU022101 [Platanthera guangdongensis]|uniref:9-cis-epoxycarotenoid dioxygenase n=1 Tax=Platanthera guangdongensis TaxID=2320717 RepID=A0ABR2LQA9_9ASPA
MSNKSAENVVGGEAKVDKGELGRKSELRRRKGRREGRMHKRGFAKVDLATGEMQKFVYSDGKYGGEPYFVPAAKEGGEEDEGYVLAFVHDEIAVSSELIIVNASGMEVEAAVQLPKRVPCGFHGTFVGAGSLEFQA